MLSPSAAYFVDLMHSRSAEAMAANKWAIVYSEPKPFLESFILMLMF